MSARKARISSESLEVLKFMAASKRAQATQPASTSREKLTQLLAEEQAKALEEAIEALGGGER